jgi:hypothetical protein
MMPRKIPVTLTTLTLFFLWGCGLGTINQLPISLKYIPSSQAEFTGTPKLESVSLGLFEDSRTGRPSGAMGELVRFNNEIDRFHPRLGVSGAVEQIVRGYFTKRAVRVLSSNWNGNADDIWGHKGDMVISARILDLWFTGRNLLTMAQASSVFQIQLKAASPKSGTVIIKTIQIEPTARRGIFWDPRDVEKWLSNSISEALDRILPDMERRLTG